MRIVHIITRLILGGAQENTLLTVEGLMERGHRVSLISGPAIGPEGELVERARSHGVDLIILPEMRRAINPFLDVAAFLFLLGYLKRERPTVVHTHSSKAGILGRLAARRTGVPIIVHTIHGLPFHPYQNHILNRTYRFLEKIAAGWSDRLVSVADAMTEQAVAAGIAPKEKFVKILSGMEVEEFLKERDRQAIRKGFGFTPEDIVIGTVGRLFHLKGHEDILRAAAKVASKFPNLKLLFVGDGILREDLKRLASSLGLEGRVVFAGLVEPSRIPEVLTAMDVVVHASFREGLPRVVPQALLCGKPVVAYDVDGAAEGLSGGKAGYLVPPKDIGRLAQSIEQVLLHPKEAHEMASLGRELCKREFAQVRMVDRIEQLYFELVQEKGLKV